MKNICCGMALAAGVRLLRFFIEASLAGHYGRGILAWMESGTFTLLVGLMIGLAVMLP